jgi:hypothetical protein
MQKPGGDDEAEAVGQRRGEFRQLGAVGVAVENGEGADQNSGGRRASATMSPNTTAETAMPVSTTGIGTARTPSAPPKAMTSGKTTGSSHSAGAPRKAPHRPTATMAAMWSIPESGCSRPLTSPPGVSTASFARAAFRGSAAATKASETPITVLTLLPEPVGWRRMFPSG